MWPILNDVETGNTPEYPDVIPQKLKAPVADVMKAVLSAIESLPRWRVQSETESQVEAVRITKLLRFRDDVTVTLSAEGDFTLVNIRSRSRVGKGDFGQNARNIRDLQRAIAQRL